MLHSCFGSSAEGDHVFDGALSLVNPNLYSIDVAINLENVVSLHYCEVPQYVSVEYFGPTIKNSFKIENLTLEYSASVILPDIKYKSKISVRYRVDCLKHGLTENELMTKRFDYFAQINTGTIILLIYFFLELPYLL